MVCRSLLGRLSPDVGRTGNGDSCRYHFCDVPVDRGRGIFPERSSTRQESTAEDYPTRADFNASDGQKPVRQIACRDVNRRAGSTDLAEKHRSRGAGRGMSELLKGVLVLFGRVQVSQRTQLCVDI